MKFSKAFFAIILFVIFGLSLSAQEIWDDAVFYYPFDGTCEDIGPNELHGTPMGNSLYSPDRFGNMGMALSFDGIDDYVDIPDNGLIECDFPVSVSLWVKVPDLSLEYTQFFANDQQFNDYGGFRVTASSTVPGAIVANYGNGQGAASSWNRKSKISNMITSADSWYHIVCVFQGPFSSIVYINGMEAGGYYNGEAEPYVGYTSGTPKIGTFPGNNIHYMDFFMLGEMDDIGMWNRCLTYDEIQYLYNYTPPVGNADIIKQDPSFKAFPIPAHSDFSIKCNSNYNDLDILIYGVHGDLVYEGHLENKSTNMIPVDSFSPGVYFYEVFAGNKMLYTEKFIKQ